MVEGVLLVFHSFLLYIDDRVGCCQGTGMLVQAHVRSSLHQEARDVP